MDQQQRRRPAFFSRIYFPASGQAMLTGVVPSPPRSLPSVFITHRVQQSHCSSIFHRVFLTHALALSACRFVHNKKSPRIYTSMHSGGFELTKLTYTRLEDNLIRHRGDRRDHRYLVHTIVWDVLTVVLRRSTAVCSSRADFRYVYIQRMKKYTSAVRSTKIKTQLCKLACDTFDRACYGVCIPS